MVSFFLFLPTRCADMLGRAAAAARHGESGVPRGDHEGVIARARPHGCGGRTGKREGIASQK
jgi:hypothetical protein